MPIGVVMLVALLSLVVACGESASPITTGNIVKLEGGTFARSTITIKKGEQIAFVQEANNGGLHILVIGQNAEQRDESGAPNFGGAAGIRVDVGQSWVSPP